MEYCKENRILPVGATSVPMPTEETRTAIAWVQQKTNRGIVFYGGYLWPGVWEERTLAPYFFFYEGLPELFNRPAILVTGTRSVFPESCRCSCGIGIEMAWGGTVLSTGLSAGIEQAAAEGCISAQGQVLAILPGGLGENYPYCPRLRAEIPGNGVLASFCLPQERARTWSFSRRSVLSSWHALCVLLVHCPRLSGALFATGAALDAGRDVYVHTLGTRPGYEMAGSRALVEEGAPVVSSYQEIAAQYRGILTTPQFSVTQQKAQAFTVPCARNELPMYRKFGTWYSVARNE